MGNKQSCLDALNNIDTNRLNDLGQAEKIGSKNVRTNYINDLCGGAQNKENTEITNFSFEDERHNNPKIANVTTEKFMQFNNKSKTKQKSYGPNEYNLYPEEGCGYNLDLQDLTDSDSEEVNKPDLLSDKRSKRDISTSSKNIHKKARKV